MIWSPIQLAHKLDDKEAIDGSTDHWIFDRSRCCVERQSFVPQARLQRTERLRVGGPIRRHQGVLRSALEGDKSREQHAPKAAGQLQLEVGFGREVLKGNRSPRQPVAWMGLAATIWLRHKGQRPRHFCLSR